jgi:hypothetical protein
MADQQYEVGVRLKGDGKGLVGETKEGTDALRQMEEQAKRTGTALQETARAQGSLRSEGTAVKQVLDAQRDATAALTRETGAMTSGMVAAEVAAVGLRGVLAGIVAGFGGPLGIIALLGSAALAWTGFGSAATQGADEAAQAAEKVERAARRTAQAVEQMMAFERLQARSAELYTESRQISERMKSREMAAEAMRRAGIKVPVERANEADVARLAEVSEQLSALRGQEDRWAAQEKDQIKNTEERKPRETPIQSRWADQDQHQALRAANAELAELRANIKYMEDGSQAFSEALAKPGIEGVESLVRYNDSLVTTHDQWGNVIKMTVAEFEKLDKAVEKKPGRDLEGEEFKRQLKNLERSLTDATVDGLIAGFRRGEDAFKNFTNRLQEIMFAAVLTPIIQPIVRPFAQAAAGVGQGIASSIFGGAGASFAGSAFGASAGGTAAGAGLGGIAGMGQVGADFGNFFGSIGATTEAGGTFGLMDAVGGFAMAHPLVAGGLALGALALGGAFKDEGDAQRAGTWAGGLGQRTSSTSNRWFSGAEMGGALGGFSSSLATGEQNLIRNLGLTPSQIESVNASLGGIAGREYGFGMEHTPVEQSGAFERIAADRLQAISSALGRSIEDLTSVMAMSAEQWQAAVDTLQERVARAEQSLAQFARGVPGQLGITSLEDYQRSLALSEVNAPLDRFAAARGQLGDVYGRAMGGDLSAVGDFQSVMRDALSIGRDVYASGAEFQDLKGESERMLNELLEHQRGIRDELLKDLPATVMQAANDQIAEMRVMKETLKSALDEVTVQLQRMQAK